MKATVQGIFMKKEDRKSKDGDKTYYSFDLYQEDTSEVISVSCKEDDYKNLPKKFTEVQAVINMLPQERWGDLSLYCRLVEPLKVKPVPAMPGK